MDRPRKEGNMEVTERRNNWQYIDSWEGKTCNPELQVNALTLDKRRATLSIEIEGREDRMDTNGGRTQIAQLLQCFLSI